MCVVHTLPCGNYSDEREVMNGHWNRNMISDLWDVVVQGHSMHLSDYCMVKYVPHVNKALTKISVLLFTEGNIDLDFFHLFSLWYIVYHIVHTLPCGNFSITALPLEMLFGW